MLNLIVAVRFDYSYSEIHLCHEKILLFGSSYNE